MTETYPKRIPGGEGKPDEIVWACCESTIGPLCGHRDPGPTGPKGQVLVAGNNRWGAGSTLDEAKRNWQEQGGRLSDGYVIVRFDDDTEFMGVDDMGRYHYIGNAPTEETVAPRHAKGRTR